MTICRCDLQMKIPWDESPLGYYYWTNGYYGDIRDFEDLDNWLFSIQEMSSLAHNAAVDQDWIRAYEVVSGTVRFNTTTFWSHNPTLVGPYAAVENTVYVGLFAGGKQVGFKRLRSPVQTSDLDGDRLTSAARDYYQGVMEGGILYAPARHCTRDGVFYDEVRVSPLVHNWQKRHGTKRSRYRRLHA